MKNLKKRYIFIFMLIGLGFIGLGTSYAFFTNKREEHGKLNIVVGDLTYKLESSDLVNQKITVGPNEIREIVITLTSLNSIDSKYELYYTLDQKNDDIEVGYSNDTKNPVLGIIEAKKSKTITVIVNNKGNISTTVTFSTIGGLVNNELVLTKGNSLNIEIKKLYQEKILNGADPILTNNLIPVTIDDDGKTRKADIYKEWYSYEKKNWANAVVLKDDTIPYENNSMIPEENIESYFVWIPKYSYQLWDLGEYNSLTSIDNTKPHAIPIKFGLTNTSDSIAGECTTPKVAGESGNCKVGDYVTHPAFLAFDSNGLWVGKFETGYEKAENTTAAEVNSSDSSKIIIKPNAYSWRSITVGNAFEASYNYLRSQDSHMMKNTEWGAVAYLTNSNYGRCTNGSCSETRINNNSNFITGYASVKGAEESGYTTEGISPKVDGVNTINYLNSQSSVASTTENKSGIYDTSGGAWEYVMGYTTGASKVGGDSGITTIHPDFFTNSNWSKYYDQYTASINTDYNNRILGDATGELGPFNSYQSSWYHNQAYYVYYSDPWFDRGGGWHNGTDAGSLAFHDRTGGTHIYVSFRVVLAPSTK